MPFWDPDGSIWTCAGELTRVIRLQTQIVFANQVVGTALVYDGLEMMFILSILSHQGQYVYLAWRGGFIFEYIRSLLGFPEIVE